MQLSSFGKRRIYVNLSRSEVPMPTQRPIKRLPKKTRRKVQKLSMSFKGVRPELFSEFSADCLYLWAVSKRTIAIASFRMDSPKMTV